MKMCECGCGQENRGRGRYRHGHRPAETLAPIDALCACGCGQRLPDDRASRYYRPKYLKGHSGRGRSSSRRYLPSPEEIPSGLCECGCGRPTTIASKTTRELRHFAGHPVPYVMGHYHPEKRKGGNNPRPKPARRIENGYVYILRPDHPNVPKDGYMLEHRLVWEETHGRLLERAMHVHHINGIRDDNRPENLVALTRAEHRRLHRLETDNPTDETRQKLSTATKRAWDEGRMRPG